jgi:hypothetical protein
MGSFFRSNYNHAKTIITTYSNGLSHTFTINTWLKPLTACKANNKLNDREHWPYFYR